MFLKKIFNAKIIKIFIIVFCLLKPVNSKEVNLLNDALIYLSNLNVFSSSFLQIQNNEVSEGLFYIKGKRIRIEYKKPNELVFVLKKNKGMYYNVGLQEVQYFNPEKTIGWFIIDLFNNENFLSDSKTNKKKGHFYIYKKVEFDDVLYNIKIYFEEKPFHLRKIEIISDLEIITFTLINPNFNPTLDDKIFSLANPLLS